MYDVATRWPKTALQHRPFFMSYVAQDKISKAQLAVCMAYFKKNSLNATVSRDEFEAECGIGTCPAMASRTTMQQHLFHVSSERAIEYLHDIHNDRDRDRYRYLANTLALSI